MIEQFRGQSLRGELLRGSVASIVIKTSSMLLTLVLAIVLARTLGVAGYGTYSFAYALVSLLAVPAQLGLPSLVVRETAKACEQKDWALLAGLWQWSTRGVLILSGVIASASVTLLIILRTRIETNLMETIAIGLVLVPLVALGNLRGAALRGLHKIVAGQLPEFILRPVFLILICALLSSTSSATPQTSMAAHAAAATAALVIGAFMLLRYRPAELRSVAERKSEFAAWRQAVIPLGLLAAMQMVNLQIGVIALGFLSNPEEAGIFRAVMQVSVLLAFAIRTTEAVITPQIARLHARSDIASIQKLSTISARANLFLTAPLAIIILIWGGDILSIALGSDFAPGHAALSIVIIGRLLHAAMGPLEHLLTMTNHERSTSKGLVLSAAINIALNVLLVPFWGAIGAAIASTIGVIVWTLLLRASVFRTIGVRCSAFSTTASRP